MSIAFRLAYVAYGRGTHHKLALDALNRLAPSQGEGWQRLFLKHAEAYALASKRPDDEFKDFKNHVLHPRDKYWGGAPAACQKWYGTLIDALRGQQWPQAVEAAGVLGHYLADPLMPFHTAQSDAENAIHRACEWSINRAYDGLYAEGCKAHADMACVLPRDANWLTQAVCANADLSNAHYEALIAHYDITRGVVEPPAGLDAVARRICSEMLVRAAATIAAVLDRAFEEAAVQPPEVSLTLDALLAAVKIPRAQFVKKFADAAERKQVEAIYDELMATGKVVANLPEESRVVRDTYAIEVATPRAKPDVAKLFGVTAVKPKVERVAATIPPPVHESMVPASPNLLAGVQRPAIEMAPPPAKPPRADAKISDGKIHLNLADEVVEAPSIGPKTAARLHEHGIKTVADLCAADAPALAGKVAQRHISEQTIRDWQDQAGLVMAIAELRGTHAQLLVGAGYRTRAGVASADTKKLCADVLAFAATDEGRRVLHDGPAPSAAKISAWQGFAELESVA